MLSSAHAAEVLVQAVLPHPMLGARWRWNLNRALILPRMRGGRRRPIHLQRMEADDLLAAVWPGLAACQENAPARSRGRARSRPGPPDGGRLPARGALGRGLGRPVGQGRVRRGGDARCRVVRALAVRPRHLERPTLHLPRRGAARGTPHPRPLAAAGPGRARARTACRWRSTSWARSTPTRWPWCSTRSGPGRATSTNCTTSCSRWWPAGRSPSGPAGSTALVADGRASLMRRLLGRRPSAPPWRPSWPTTTTARPPASAGTCNWPARSRSRHWSRISRCPRGAPKGAPLSLARARDGAGPSRRARVGPPAARWSLVRPPSVWSASTGPAAIAGAAWSIRCPIAHYVRFLTQWQHAAAGQQARGPGRPAGRDRAAPGH